MEQLLLKGRNHLALKNELAQPLPLLPSMLMPATPGISLIHAEQSPKSRGALKRSVDVLTDTFYPEMLCKRQALDGIPFAFNPPFQYQPIFQFPTPAERKFLLKSLNRDN